MMLPFDQYFKRYGIRLPSQIPAPRLIPISRLTLPRNAMLHYLPESETEIGPPSELPIFNDVTRLVFVGHETELKNRTGNPLKAFIQPTQLINQYKTRYRKMRMLAKLSIADREPLNLIVINYAIAARTVRYTRSFFSQYYAWYNVQASMWKTVAEYLQQTDREQFIVVNLPTVIPALTALRKAENNVTRETLKAFSDTNALAVLDLFSWVGPNRHKSLINNIPKDKLGKINIVVKDLGAWFVINLGVLNSWRKPPASEWMSDEDFQRASPEAKKAELKYRSSGADPKALSVKLLAMLTILHEQGTLAAGPDAVKMVEQDVSKDDLLETDIDSVVESTADLEKELEALEIPLSEEEEQALDVEFTLSEDLVDNSVDKAIDEDGNIVREAMEVDPADDLPPAVGVQGSHHQTYESAIQAKAEELASTNGLLSAGEYKRIQGLATVWRTLPNPYGGQGTLADAVRINPEDLILKDGDHIPDMPEVFDKSMLNSTVEKFDRQYVEHVLKKDVLNMVMMMQKANVAVTGYEIERVVDAVSDHEIHSVQLTPVVGRASTIRFRIPTISEEGTYISNGVTYHLRKQRADMPIRKVTPIRVALSSYYAKLFVESSERSQYNYDRFLAQAVVDKGLNTTDGTIEDVRISNVSDDSLNVPRVYAILSERLVSFKSGGFYFFFDYAKRFTQGGFDEERVKRLEKDGLVVVARKGSQHILLDRNDVFYKANEAGDLTVLGRAEELFSLPADKAPVPMAEFKLFGKTIPIGVVLGYLVGLDNLIRKLGVHVRRVPNGERLNLTDVEYAVRFLDESLVFNREDARAALIFSGFNLYHKAIRQYTANAFNKKDIYLNLLESYGLGVKYLRELDLLQAMFVDPITHDLLVWMKEPTDFIDLLIRSCELLQTRYVPQKVEGADGFVDNLERVRGYERIPGAVYGELIRAVRMYNGRTSASSSTISLNPHAVWMSIVGDPAAAPIEQTNPIRNLKEREVMTFGGRGGRSRRSMVAENRIYQKSDMGFVSEATVDSGDVAIITYLSPNANLTSIRGTVRSLDEQRDGSSSLISTAALLAPCADRDDPKRVNFINIQQSHGISAMGYQASPLRTGYEQILAHRVDSMYAKAAKENGTVVSVTNGAITVEYDNGDVTTVELGRKFGVSAGTVYPNDLVANFTAGEKVKKGDILAYNSGFFEPNAFEPKQVVWKAGVLAKTALMEASYTLEDSSAITERIAEKLGTQMTKVKTITVRFDQAVRSMVQVGDVVDLDSILCTIEDAVTSGAGLFDDDAADTLRLLSAQTPRAKVVGVVEKIEVFYHGDVEDMSESLQAIAHQADKERRRRARGLKILEVTGSVDQSMRIEGEGLDLDHAAIRIYITTNVGTGVGDKAVFANQMKTVFGHILTGVNETEDGTQLDAIFGFKSIQDRIVLSPMIIGSTNTLLRVIGEKAAKMYFEAD